MFRAFLFPQIFFLVRSRFTTRAGLIVAAVASQAVFAVMNIPNRLLVKDVIGTEVAIDQIRLLISG